MRSLRRYVKSTLQEGSSINDRVTNVLVRLSKSKPRSNTRRKIVFDVATGAFTPHSVVAHVWLEVLRVLCDTYDVSLDRVDDAVAIRNASSLEKFGQRTLELKSVIQEFVVNFDDVDMKEIPYKFLANRGITSEKPDWRPEETVGEDYY